MTSTSERLIHQMVALRHSVEELRGEITALRFLLDERKGEVAALRVMLTAWPVALPERDLAVH
jgi:hypothetical protein